MYDLGNIVACVVGIRVGRSRVVVDRARVCFDETAGASGGIILIRIGYYVCEIVRARGVGFILERLSREPVILVVCVGDRTLRVGCVYGNIAERAVLR